MREDDGWPPEEVVLVGSLEAAEVEPRRPVPSEGVAEERR